MNNMFNGKKSWQIVEEIFTCSPPGVRSSKSEPDFELTVWLGNTSAKEVIATALQSEGFIPQSKGVYVKNRRGGASTSNQAAALWQISLVDPMSKS